MRVQCPQAQAPPHAHPALAPLDGVEATNEKRRRTRSLPQDGHASAVSTVAVIERLCSNTCSHAMHTYS